MNACPRTCLPLYCTSPLLLNVLIVVLFCTFLLFLCVAKVANWQSQTDTITTTATFLFPTGHLILTLARVNTFYFTILSHYVHLLSSWLVRVESCHLLKTLKSLLLLLLAHYRRSRAYGKRWRGTRHLLTMAHKGKKTKIGNGAVNRVKMKGKRVDSWFLRLSKRQ